MRSGELSKVTQLRLAVRLSGRGIMVHVICKAKNTGTNSVLGGTVRLGSLKPHKPIRFAGSTRKHHVTEVVPSAALPPHIQSHGCACTRDCLHVCVSPPTMVYKHEECVCVSVLH